MDYMGAGRYHMDQLRSQLTGLPKMSAMVVHNTRRAVLEEDALTACSLGRTNAVVVHAKNLAVLAQYLAPMVFKLLLGLTGAALMIAEGPAPAPGDANVALLSQLMSSAAQLAGQLLQYHQSAGEECRIQIGRSSTEARKYASRKAKEAHISKVAGRTLMRDADDTEESADYTSGVSIGSGIGAVGALAVAALASGPIGWAALVIAGGSAATSVVTGAGAAEKRDKVKKLTEQAAKCRNNQIVIEEEAAKGHAAVETLKCLLKVGEEQDASNSTVTGLLTTVLYGLLCEWQLVWETTRPKLHKADGKTDEEIMSDLRSLNYSIKVTAMDWDSKVRGAACGLVAACGVPANVKLLEEFLEKNKDMLSENRMTVEQGFKVITDINRLPSNVDDNMAGRALGLYMKKNTQLLLKNVDQTVLELLGLSEETEGALVGPEAGQAAT